MQSENSNSKITGPTRYVQFIEIHRVCWPDHTEMELRAAIVKTSVTSGRFV